MGYVFKLVVITENETKKSELKDNLTNRSDIEFYLVKEEENTMTYNFTSSLAPCLEVLQVINVQYPCCKFKLAIDKEKKMINYYSGMLKAKARFGAFVDLKKYPKQMIIVNDFSNAIYRNRCKLLFKRVEKSNYEDNDLLYDFLNTITAYYHYRSNDKEYKLKQELFYQLYSKMKPYLKCFFKSEFSQFIRIGIINNFLETCE